jgi:HlyD family secretion protein
MFNSPKGKVKQIRTNKTNGGSLIGWVAAVAVLAAAAAGGWWYWQHQGDEVPEYKTAPITRGDMVQLVTATGQLNPQTNVNVGSQVSGIIKNLYADFNSRVTNGQVIAELDPATFQAVVAGAEADVAYAKANAELAKVNMERSTALYQSKILAQADYDTAVATYDQAKAQVQQKEAALKQAKVNLAYTVIYAPVDGIVLSRNVDRGQTVAASFSSPTLFMIANDLSKMQIDSYVSEADIGGIEQNQKVNFTVDAFPTRIFPGLVTEIRNAPQTNQNVITYDTVISVDNSELKLRPGMTANVSIITAQRNNVLRIPNAALRFHPAETTDSKKDAAAPSSNTVASATGGDQRGGQGGGNAPGQGRVGGGRPKGEHVVHTVYTLKEGAAGKPPTLVPVQIKTGINDGAYTQVLDGLNEGDEVVVSQTISSATAQTGSSNPFGGGGRRF